MSGGSLEYVMGNFNNIIGGSGFEIMPESKYYDKYTSDAVSDACNGSLCLSHGLSEVGAWYNDSMTLGNKTSPWLYNGGSYFVSGNAGIYYHSNYSGNAYYANTFRLVLSINN